MDSQQLVSDTMRLAFAIAANIGKRLPRHVDPQDLCQDAYCGLLMASRRYDPNRGVSFRAYARRRINGAVLDGLRKTDHLSRQARAVVKAEGTERFAKLVQLECTEEIEGELLAPDRWAIRAELRELLMAAMEDLPVVVREVLHSYYFEHKPMSEIATHLGISGGRVSQLHRRGVELVRQYLQDHCVTSVAEVCA